MYMKLKDGMPEKYSIPKLRKDNPNTSFPRDMPDAALADWGVYAYTRKDRPSYNPEIQTCSEGDFEQVDGNWFLGWVVTDKPIAEIREGSEVTRREFCNNLAAIGVLTNEDAIRGALGFWPDAMLTFLEYLTPEQSRDIQIEWATAANVRRMHPFVLLLGSWLNLTDEQVDTLFGIGA